MSWTLRITPRGILYEKFYETKTLYNSNSVTNIENTHVLPDYFSSNLQSNTVDLRFALEIYDNNPLNLNAKPDIVGVSEFVISNDADFKDVLVLSPEIFSSYYSEDTSYTFDFSSYNVEKLTFPAIITGKFTQTSGSGEVIFKNWPLSDGSGIKRVYYKIIVQLSDGTSATFLNNYDGTDYIDVLSSEITAPYIPDILTKVKINNSNYTILPVVASSDVASNSNAQTTDSGISNYYWDILLTTGKADFIRNDNGIANYELFNSIKFNQSIANSCPEIIPIVPGLPTIYFEKTNAAEAFSFSNSKNIAFFESKIQNKNSKNFSAVSSDILTYDFSLINSSDERSISISISFNDKLSVATIKSINDTASENSVLLTDKTLISKLFYGGSFIFFVEVISATEKIYFSKLLFKGQNDLSFSVIYETLFTTDRIAPGSLKFQILVTASDFSGEVIIEGYQYGLCYGVVSGGVLPIDKLKFGGNNIDASLSPKNDNNVTESWLKLINSPFSAGCKIETNESITFFNEAVESGDYVNVTSELQSQVPVFSDVCSVDGTLFWQDISLDNQIAKVGYSFDNNLSFYDLNFDNHLLFNDGEYLPYEAFKYSIYGKIVWSDSSNFDLNIEDVNENFICNTNNQIGENLFLLSENSPQVIKSTQSLTTTNTFRSWISTNGFSTTSIENSLLVFTNTGNTKISIGTPGITSIAPNQSFVFSGLSTLQASPNNLVVYNPSATLTNSVNFVYDFGHNFDFTSARSVSLSILIAEPPLIPTSVPSFQYSVEVSGDFINWTYLPNSTLTTEFNANTGKVKLSFNGQSTAIDIRFCRVRIYKNLNASFDPTLNHNYSNFSATYDVSTITNNISGKVLLGFTDTSAKNASLGQLVNLPTYTRIQNSSNQSKVVAVALDFTDYNPLVGGPTYLKLITNSSESIIKVFETEFNKQVNYQVKLTIKRKTIKSGYALVPEIKINQLGFDETLENIILESQLNEDFQFGFYPFVSLSGPGFVQFTSLSSDGLAITEQNNFSKNYITIFSSKDPENSPNFAKNLIYQNTFDISKIDFPFIDNYFSINRNRFKYEDIDSRIVKAVAAQSIVLYGEQKIDGIYVKDSDLVLVAAQGDKAQNGLYEVTDTTWNQIFISNQNSTTFYVKEGIIFNDTLWMFDAYNQEWISNVIQTSINVEKNNLLKNTVNYLDYPGYVIIPVSIETPTEINSLNQVKVKFVTGTSNSITETSTSTPWCSLFANNQFYSLKQKHISGNTLFCAFQFSKSQILNLIGKTFPSNLMVLISYSGNFQPCASRKSLVSIPKYGAPYRVFQAPHLNIQAFSQFVNISYAALNQTYIKDIEFQLGSYARNVADVVSPQSTFSELTAINNYPPVLGNLFIQKDNVKNVILGVSTTPVSENGTLAARIIQTNPLAEQIYGSWFGYANQAISGINTNASSLVGLSTFVAFPSIFSNGLRGLTTAEPLSGFYKYQLQVIDALGNWAVTNEVKNFYYENAIIDTQPPSASVSFVNQNFSAPISITSSSVVDANLVAVDASTAVKAFQYRILPNQTWSNWIDYVQFSKIIFDSTITDGTKTVQFKFKDFADNEIQSNADSNNFTWNIISKLFNNILFTVMENATLSDDTEVLLIGGSSENKAVLFLWNGNILLQVQYSALANSSAVTALKNVDGSNVLIGTDYGQVFIFNKGVITGPQTQFKWGSAPLSISNFEVHKFKYDVESVYASTLTIPRIFYTAITNLENPSWSVLQPNPITLESIQILNNGLWSGSQIYASISSTYIKPTLNFKFNYGISSVIINNAGDEYDTNAVIQTSGLINNFVGNIILQGSLVNIQPLTSGSNYSTASITIDPPGPGVGTIQATGIANTSSGKIVSYTITNPGFGYTTIPKITISGSGTGASAAAVINRNKIYAVNVVSPGFATTSNITLSIIGSNNNTSASATPDFLYRIESVNISNPGFGYTSNPIISVNGISTIVLPAVQYGSIQTVGVNTNYTFKFTSGFAHTISGGQNTAWVGTFSTSAITYLYNTTPLPGRILSNIGIANSGNYLAFQPSISFASSIYDPIITFNLSDDPILNTSSGSIYDLQSKDDFLYLASSLGGIIQIDQNSNKSFNINKIDFNQEINSFTEKIVSGLATYSQNLYFYLKNSSFIGKLEEKNEQNIFDDRNYNTLLFKPFNFDVISDWQLVNNSNSSSGISTSRAILEGNLNSLTIQSFKSQTFYDSTKTSIWVERLNSYKEIQLNLSVNYTVSFYFSATKGTQSVEITTYLSTLRILFEKSGESLLIYYTSDNKTIYSSIVSSDSNEYTITVKKINNDFYIYNQNILVDSRNNFYSTATNPNTPIFRFGEIFSYLSVNVNGVTNNLLNADPYKITSDSQYTWSQIKFAFIDKNFNNFDKTYYLTLPFNLNQSEPVRILKLLNNELFAITKGSSLYNSNTIVKDNTSKVFKFMSSYWIDDTGSFEIYNQGITSSYILTSPFDTVYFKNNYYITGATKTLSQKNQNPYILLGLSSNIVYEEQDTYLTIVYPNKISAAGANLSISNNNGFLNVPNQVFFDFNTNSKTIKVGVASTSTTVISNITVTDGTNISTSSLTINPLVLSGFSLSTTSFIGYTSSFIIATVQLPSRAISNRTITITSNNATVLTVPNTGLATITYQTKTTDVTLVMGVATNIQGIVTLTASYRGSIQTSITVSPLSLSASLSTNNFVAGTLDDLVYVTASVQRPVFGNLIINAIPSVGGFFTTPNYTLIIGAGQTTSTTLLTQTGFASTNTNAVYNLSITGSSLGLAFTAKPLTFIQTVDNLRPVLPYQSPVITYKLNNLPALKCIIYNSVQTPVGIAVTYPSFTTFDTAETFQTWSFSTSVMNAAPGFAITVLSTDVSLAP
jgi:hypothetical protein